MSTATITSGPVLDDPNDRVELTEAMLQVRLAEAGVTLPEQAAPPAGAYRPAMTTGNLIFTAGQLPLVDGELMQAGKVGAAVHPDSAYQCARICAVNALAAAAAALGSLTRVTRVVKVTGFVASEPTFTGQAAVLNGASELLAHLFADRGAHARSAVGVATLPLDAPVEVEIVLEFT